MTLTATTDEAISTSYGPVGPPAKRVRREYPWRPEFVREFGVQPLQQDVVTGDVVLVECCFCVSFGREPPRVPPKPAVNKDGQPIKSRARTRNVAHWKYPFRTDNIRSHHLQQHAQKWQEYVELLEQSRHDQVATRILAGDDTDSEEGAPPTAAADGKKPRIAATLDRLREFFGGVGSSSSSTTTNAIPSPAPPVGMVETVAVVSGASKPVPRQQQLHITLRVDKTVPARRGSAVALVAGVTNATPATTGKSTDMAENIIIPTPTTNATIVDLVVSKIVDMPDDPAEVDVASRALEYLSSPPKTQLLQLVLPLFQQTNLNFGQIAAVGRVVHATKTDLMESCLTRGDVAAYARLVVIASLQGVAEVLSAAWAYSIRLTWGVRSSCSTTTTPLPPRTHVRVSVRVPTNQSQQVDDLYILTLFVLDHQDESPAASSQQRAMAFVRAMLSALDANWQRKVIGISVDGTRPHGVDPAVALREMLLPQQQQQDEPFFQLFDAHQTLQDVVHAAWATFDRSPPPPVVDQDEKQSTTFIGVLLNLLTRLRTNGKWVERHGHCPFVRRQDAWSVFHALHWLLAQREAIPTATTAPTWWWLVACVMVEVWTDTQATTTQLAAYASRDELRIDALRLHALVRAKCCIGGSGEEPSPPSKSVAQTAVSSAATDAGSSVWSPADIKACFQSLNESTRQLFAEMAKESTTTSSSSSCSDSFNTVVREVLRFVLPFLDGLQALLPPPLEQEPPPPTLPLEFTKLDPAHIEDLVQSHRKRLEAAFPSTYCDGLSRDIRNLQAVVAADDQLRRELERVLLGGDDCSRQSVFTASWQLVPPQFASLRAFAAGLATVLPSQSSTAVVGESSHSSFAAFTCDEPFPQLVLAELAVEARFHAQQLQQQRWSDRVVVVDQA